MTFQLHVYHVLSILVNIWAYPFKGPLKEGISVGCQVQMFYSVGCRLENYSVECQLGIITLSFRKWVLSVGVNIECRVSSTYFP